MPAAGAKKRETKSTPLMPEVALTIYPRYGSNASALSAGFKHRTSSSLQRGTSWSKGLTSVSMGSAPRVSANAGGGLVACVGG